MGSFLVRCRQRRTVRRDVSAPCQAVELRDFRLVGQRVLDLSPRGLLLACDDEARVGDDMMVSFQIPGAGPWLDLEAEVTRVVEGFRSFDRGYCAGLRFTQVGQPELRALVTHLAGYPPPVPARHLRVDYAETVRRIAAAA